MKSGCAFDHLEGTLERPTPWSLSGVLGMRRALARVSNASMCPEVLFTNTEFRP